MVTICAMTATIMQALDTTIANVALPYMQGTLSASQDQINWVLTSYIVAAAIMTAPVGWIANRFGRKRIEYRCVYCALSDAKSYNGDITILAPSELKGKPVLLTREGGSRPR